MEIIFIGLGRMGAAMSRQLVAQNFSVYGFDQDPNTRKNAAALGVQTFETLQTAVAANSSTPRVVWLMVPSAHVDDVLTEITPLLAPEDVIIDGGNSFYMDSIRRHSDLSAQGFQFVDCGVSGGMEGAHNGASLMVGGEVKTVQPLTPLFTALATENGFAHVGGPGAGHYVKMVHNGIEYGMMSALAEGMHIIESHSQEFEIDVDAVLKPYAHGSIIAGSLMNWLTTAYQTPGYLEAIAGTVPRGETESEMEALVEANTFPSLEAALAVRKDTRSKASRVGTLLAAMRNQFGGHQVIHEHGDQNT